MTGGTDQLPKGIRLRTGPGRGGYVVAAVGWLGGWLGLFAAGHAAWWEYGRTSAEPTAVPTDGLLGAIPLICLVAVAAGFIVWLVVNRLRASAQRRLFVDNPAAPTAPAGWRQ